MTKQTSSDNAWQEKSLALQNAIADGQIALKGHSLPPSLWDVIALYMHLLKAGETDALKGIEQYCHSLPGLNLANLELMLKEPVIVHGYLTAPSFAEHLRLSLRRTPSVIVVATQP